MNNQNQVKILKNFLISCANNKIQFEAETSKMTYTRMNKIQEEKIQEFEKLIIEEPAEKLFKIFKIGFPDLKADCFTLENLKLARAELEEMI